MNYKARLDRIRTELDKRGLDGIFISSDANWEYAAGIPRLGRGNTKQRQNSLEYCGLLVTANEAVVFVPRLTSLGLVNSISGCSWISKIVIFMDRDLHGDTFISELKSLKLNNGTIGVIQDVSSSVVIKLRDELGSRCVNADKIIQDMRCRKDDEEIMSMREASGIADRIFDKVYSQLRPGIPLIEIEREIDRLCTELGGSMTSFPSTVYQHGVKSGPGLDDNHTFVEKGHMLAFDFGVVCNGYCSDFGRTVFVGQPDCGLVKIYELVLASQNEGIKLLCPQSAAWKVNEAARDVIEEAGYGDNFIHRLGHGIGMDVHERPFLAEGEDRVIDAGMTFTVEPSIFIPKRCLIRVEDVVLVSEKGPEVLNNTTKEILVIE